MKTKQIIISLIGAAAALLILAIVFWLGDKHGVQSMTFKRVTANQLADAMKGDHFYSDYRKNTLLLSAEVGSIKNSGSTNIVTFKTTTKYSVKCDFGTSKPSIRVGDVILIATEGATAVRESSGVLLKSCLIP